MIIAIDGPAGSGKSTAARGLAKFLGFDFLDTGAMYRAVALFIHEAGIDTADKSHIAALLPDIQIDMLPGAIILNGLDVSRKIRSPVIAALSSQVATQESVRQYLVCKQRELAQGRNMVSEGRDQGTVVFPHAERKFFLTASPQARAYRRMQEMRSRGLDVHFEQVLAEQEERDCRDSSRTVGPLRCAADAIVIDTSTMTSEQVLEKLIEDVQRCRG